MTPEPSGQVISNFRSSTYNLEDIWSYRCDAHCKHDLFQVSECSCQVKSQCSAAVQPWRSQGPGPTGERDLYKDTLASSSTVDDMPAFHEQQSIFTLLANNICNDPKSLLLAILCLWFHQAFDHRVGSSPALAIGIRAPPQTPPSVDAWLMQYDLFLVIVTNFRPSSLAEGTGSF